MRYAMVAVVLGVGFVLAAVHTFGQQSIATDSRSSIAADSRAFELRTYTAAPVKLEALHARFRDHTNGLFKQHGMAVVGYWVPTDKPDTLVYLLVHPSRAKAAEAWKSFGADPDWVTARKASEVNGSLTVKVESVFMSATDYSPLK